MPSPSRFLCDKCALVLGGPWTIASENNPCERCTGPSITPAPTALPTAVASTSTVARTTSTVAAMTQSTVAATTPSTVAATPSTSTSVPGRPTSRFLCDKCALVLGGPWTIASKENPCERCNKMVQALTRTDAVKWSKVETPRKAARKHKARNATKTVKSLLTKSPLKGSKSKSKSALTKSSKSAVTKRSTTIISAPGTTKSVPSNPPMNTTGATQSVRAIPSTSTISAQGIAWRSPYLPAPTLAPQPQHWPVQYWSAIHQPYGQAPARASTSASISAPVPVSFAPAPAPLRFIPVYAPAPAPLPPRALAPAPLPPPTPVPIPLPPERGAPPKRILLPPPTPASDEKRPAKGTAPVIAYQTLALLLADLNRLLTTPHGGPGFDFRGTCAEIIGPRDLLRRDDLAQHAQVYGGDQRMRARVLKVAWEVLDRTVLAFDVHGLMIHAGGQAAVAKVKSAAMWMGDPRLVEAPSPPTLVEAAAAANGRQANGRNSKETNGRKQESEKEKDRDLQTQAQANEGLPCKRCEHLLTISVVLELRKNAMGVSIAVGLMHFKA
ncbi:hypothetical protein C8R45DRAFT_1212616 [Mycena sanguinolenta]|nr:hypothetical protein C8R45DRAFT_1212616 [Mycena sanguinolenta]